MKFRIITTLIVGLSIATSFTYAKTITVKCTIQGATNGYILVRNLTSPSIAFDTFRYTKPTFTFPLTFANPSPIVVYDDAQHYTLLFLDPNNVTLVLKKEPEKLSTISCTPSKSNKLHTDFLQNELPINARFQELYQARMSNKGNADSLDKLLNEVVKISQKNFYSFIQTNNNTEVASYVVYSSFSQDKNIPLKIIDSIYNMLGDKGKKTFYGNETRMFLQRNTSMQIGKKIPDFEMTDTTGKLININTLRGKYVLVDFWASWCGPCRAEFPYMKKAYSNFKSKGFEIFAVSLDGDKNKWLTCIQRDALSWVQVSDLKAGNSLVHKLFNVPSIPRSLLLDKTGTIIATDLRGESLENKLTELLGK